MAQYISQPRLEGPILLEPSDLSFLRTLVAETETQAESLENQIKQAGGDEYTELIHEKDAKIVELASLRNILAPIRRMPLEIFSEILELACFPSDGIFTSVYNIMRYISRVSLVCVAWRKAALSTSKLWSKICIEYKSAHQSHPDVEQIKEWLVRSKGFPLEVHLSFYVRDWSTHSPSNFDTLMDCIVEFRGQIASIDLSGMSGPLLPLFRLPCASFPLLKKLMVDLDWEVWGPREDLWNFLPQKSEAFFDAPRLQHLSIKRRRHSQLLSIFVLPLEQLTSLCIHVHFDQNSLHKCINLVSLTMCSRSGLGSDFSVCLPSLKFLDISCCDGPSHHFTLLHGLTTPVLESLVLDYIGQSINDVRREVVGLQNRSANRLSSLKLCCVSDRRNSTADDFLPILTACPTVQSLTIEPGGQANDIDVLIQALIYTKSKPVLLPQLTSLDISSSRERLRADSMISLIRSRWWSDSLDPKISDDNGVARLQKLTLWRRAFDATVNWDDLEFPGLSVFSKPYQFWYHS